MAWQLAPNVTFCVTSGTALFLDVGRDRYFALPDALTPAFLTWLETAEVSDASERAMALLRDAGIVRRVAQATKLDSDPHCGAGQNARRGGGPVHTSTLTRSLEQGAGKLPPNPTSAAPRGADRIGRDRASL